MAINDLYANDLDGGVVSLTVLSGNGQLFLCESVRACFSMASTSIRSGIES